MHVIPIEFSGADYACVALICIKPFLNQYKRNLQVHSNTSITDLICRACLVRVWRGNNEQSGVVAADMLKFRPAAQGARASPQGRRIDHLNQYRTLLIFPALLLPPSVVISIFVLVSDHLGAITSILYTLKLT